MVAGSLPAQFWQVFAFPGLSLQGMPPAGMLRPSEEVSLFFSGHGTGTVGEIIKYVDVRHVSLLKHYLISFECLIFSKRNLGQTHSKAMSDHPPITQEKISFYYKGVHPAKLLLGLLICVCGIKIPVNLRFSCHNEAWFCINSLFALSPVFGHRGRMGK